MEGQRGSNTNSMSNLGLIQGNKFEHKDSRLQCMITDKVYGQIVMKDKNKDELFHEYMRKQSLII